jgi:hypothetical protein
MPETHHCTEIGALLVAAHSVHFLVRAPKRLGLQPALDDLRAYGLRPTVLLLQLLFAGFMALVFVVVARLPTALPLPSTWQPTLELTPLPLALVVCGYHPIPYISHFRDWLARWTCGWAEIPDAPYSLINDITFRIRTGRVAFHPASVLARLLDTTLSPPFKVFRRIAYPRLTALNEEAGDPDTADSIVHFSIAAANSGHSRHEARIRFLDTLEVPTPQTWRSRPYDPNLIILLFITVLVVVALAFWLISIGSAMPAKAAQPAMIALMVCAAAFVPGRYWLDRQFPKRTFDSSIQELLCVSALAAAACFLISVVVRMLAYDYVDAWEQIGANLGFLVFPAIVSPLLLLMLDRRAARVAQAARIALSQRAAIGEEATLDMLRPVLLGWHWRNLLFGALCTSLGLAAAAWPAMYLSRELHVFFDVRWPYNAPWRFVVVAAFVGALLGIVVSTAVAACRTFYELRAALHRYRKRAEGNSGTEGASPAPSLPPGPDATPISAADRLFDGIAELRMANRD